MGRPAAKLRTLDLFSGGGGNALAFRDFSDVALYCEFADAPLAVLKAAMRRGDIDRAPVHSDVRTLLASKAYAAAKAGPRPMMVTGSWPCQGNSRAGKQLGMADPRSGLIRELCDIVEDCAPEVFFGENTPLVATDKNGSLRYLEERLHEKYELSFMLSTADHLGFLHRRRRFFVVGRRRDFDLAGHLAALRLRDPLRRLLPDAGAEPRRVVAAPDKHFKARMHVAGNAVVPAMSLYAFLVLAGAAAPRPAAAAARSFVLDPDAWVPPRSSVPSPALNVDKLIAAPRAYALAPTPRSGNIGSNNYLTERSAHDLCTFVRFERDTPNALRGKPPNMDWVDWLMVRCPEKRYNAISNTKIFAQGYPAGYTNAWSGTEPAVRVPRTYAPPPRSSTEDARGDDDARAAANALRRKLAAAKRRKAAAARRRAEEAAGR